MPVIVNGKTVDAFTWAYIAAAFWTADDEVKKKHSGEFAISVQDAERLDAESLQQMIDDCNKFRQIEKESDSNALRYWTDKQAGHDFWLTRNRHGVGFWDRGYSEAGEVLTSIARSFGEVELILGGDELIYLE